jgi:Mce-associated membrane protein
VFGVVAALAIAGVVVSALLLLTHPSQEDLRKSALLAARQYTTALTTYDARTLDEDVARVTKVSTAEFARQYQASIASNRAQIVATGTASAGTVVGAGIENLDEGSATVLVAVNQHITTTGQSPRSEANRLRMGLVRRNGGWYISSVQRL